MSMPTAPALGDFASIPMGTNIPTQIAPAQPGIDVTLANQDLTNAITISRSRNFQVGSGNAVTIPPLGSITVDNSKTIWALAPTGTLPILVFPGGGNWAPSPAQVAAQINALGLAKETTQQTGNTLISGVNTTLGAPAQDPTVSAVPTGIFNTGVPLAHKSTVILHSGSTALPANANTQVGGTLTFTQHSFEMRLPLTWQTADGIVGIVVVTINWIDSNTGLQTDQDQYATIVASTADTTGFYTRIAGPTKADQAQLFIRNLEAAAGRTVLVDALVLANSRALTGDSLDVPRLTQFSTATAGTVGATGDSRYLLGAQNNTLAAAATDTWLCTPGVGPIWLNVFETGVAGSNIDARLRMTPNSFYSTTGNGAWLVRDILTAGVPNKLNASLYQAGGPMIFQITNNGAVAANYSVAIVRGQPLE